ncbi:hypothetical protein pdam_00013078 [Pocillopora damicornis]|uniref:Carbonic anhydrase n=1 Tax=Pocillopora damicornis TaxID=46731 RepID=A0A3M6TJM2_POCDA|nr:hypothetical protein pdam_00013078 [Pocillopora damicornis]
MTLTSQDDHLMVGAWTACGVALFLKVDIAFSIKLGGTPWTYDRGIAGAKGPDEWETLNGNWSCNGRKQSPIDVGTDQVMQKDPTNPPNLRLTVAGNKPITGEIRNNGYAPTFFLAEELTVKLAGGLLQENYFLKQFHFHFGCNNTVGSEHTIDGNTYPIELHMVFWDNTNYATYKLAAQGEDGLAVVSVLYELPMANIGTTPANNALEKIARLLNNVVEENSNYVVTQSEGLHIEDLAPLLASPDVADRFYKYKGSLTTPGCYESVTWFVMNNHPQITEQEILAFRNLKSSKAHAQGPNVGRMCNNFRNVMPLNGRQIHSNIVLE